MTTKLSVNLNKIALIRNSREGNNPDLITHALQCIKAGAHGITIHPRPDQRHIRASDVSDLKQHINVELNIEGNPLANSTKSNRADVSDYPGFIELVNQNSPEQCTLVPDSDTQLTSDHGFDLRKQGDTLAPIIKSMKSRGTRVSLFLDPDIEQITLAKEIGADRIELYTGPFAESFASRQQDKSLFKRYKNASEHALNIGLGLNAGHDLNLTNLIFFKQLIPGLQEVSIGHALTIDAIQFGLTKTIERYLECLK